jgi:hypothetical protein
MEKKKYPSLSEPWMNSSKIGTNKKLVKKSKKLFFLKLFLKIFYQKNVKKKIEFC